MLLLYGIQLRCLYVNWARKLGF